MATMGNGHCRLYPAYTVNNGQEDNRREDRLHKSENQVVYENEIIVSSLRGPKPMRYIQYGSVNSLIFCITDLITVGPQ